jgi:hypothetical protein
MIPLGPADVPPGSVLRRPETPKSNWISVDSVSDVWLCLAGGPPIPWADLQAEGWLIKRGPGMLWVPCCKEREKP